VSEFHAAHHLDVRLADMSTDSESRTETEDTSDSTSSSDDASQREDIGTNSTVQGLAVPHMDGPLDWYITSSC
jgi:hypothetical protein